MMSNIEERIGTITMQVDFDDLIALECVKEVLEERIKASDSWEDQKVMRQWRRTVGRFLAITDNALWRFSDGD
jgi:hypothetical protein